ncbi:Hypothetical predicted protein [Paramuricea clavata]|uniref:Uncharacterized protein n=1 Tax=Paramuricea clavata TaxID=317549 RepID=A0A6S7G3M2_PARCT|nr:Hypothetical predicted protein [Paramuricea clavata]CAB3980420.1 Hypothetical predicted protein [Paramuricea clavata]
MGMTYLKYLQYNVELLNKIVRIVQFSDRVPRGKINYQLSAAGFNTSYLQDVKLPMVLPHVRIWLLCKHHELSESEIKEQGNFVLGGRNRFLEDDLVPYKNLVNNFMETKNYAPCEFLKGGHKICEYADALSRLPYDKI